MNKKEVNKILERIEYCAMKIGEELTFKSKKDHRINSAKLSIDTDLSNLRSLLKIEK
jgi:hypothetical protein